MTDKSRSWLERFTAMLGREPKNKDEIMGILRDAEDRGVLSDEMLGMIERILHVSEMEVREVMVPKAQMIIIKKNMPLSTIMSLVIESGHSRFPVLDDQTDEVIGILLAKDLLKFTIAANQALFNLKDIMREAIFAPQSKRLDILLREFRVNRNHIAIVLDEYSHLAGLITIEDVLEQIVGEIEDEYDIDEEDAFITKLGDDMYIVKAGTPIDEFNEYFNSRFTDEAFDTIGGIVLKEFGHLPKRGENIKIRQFRFKVLHGDNRRLYLLEVKSLKKPAAK